MNRQEKPSWERSSPSPPLGLKWQNHLPSLLPPFLPGHSHPFPRKSEGSHSHSLGKRWLWMDTRLGQTLPTPPQPFAGVPLPAVPPGRLRPHCHQELSPHWSCRKGMLLEQARRTFKAAEVSQLRPLKVSALAAPPTFGLHQQPRGSAQHLLPLGWADSPGTCPSPALRLLQSEESWDSPLGGCGAAGEARLEQSNGFARSSSFQKSSSISWHDEGPPCIHAGTLRH